MQLLWLWNTVFLVCWFIPFTSFAAVQFIDGLWLKDTNIYAGNSTRVYVALRNGAPADITGVVRMYSNGEFLGEKQVSALPGRLIETWVDWTPNSPGVYELSATLSRVRIHYPSGPESVPDTNATISRSAVEVTAQPEPEVNTSTTETEVKQTSTSTILSDQGLEQYIPEGTLNNQLTRLTQQLSIIDEQLAHIQSDRASKRSHLSTELSTTTPSDTEFDAWGRPTGTTTIGELLSRPAQDFFIRNWNNFVDHSISALRWLLAHPMLIQIFGLLLTLFVIYRLARRFGRRR